MTRCGRIGVIPTYMGPLALEGLEIGDNIKGYLHKASGEHESASEPGSSSSSDESEESEPDEPSADTDTPAQRHAAVDSADLYDNEPPTQPPSRASKFDQDLGSVAGIAAGATLHTQADSPSACGHAAALRPCCCPLLCAWRGARTAPVASPRAASHRQRCEEFSYPFSFTKSARI